MYTSSVTQPLINTTKRIKETKNILFYEKDKVQEICEEINLLKHEIKDFNDNDENLRQEKINVYDNIQKKELNAIQLYHFERIQKNKVVANKETILTHNELNRLTDQEQSFYKKYEQFIHNFKNKLPESFYTSSELHAPKRPYTIVRVIENIGEVVTKNGTIGLLKGSQTIVREADPTIAKLIKLGHLKKIDK
ncbi:unnamed protein product [Rhizophagus irregularis]|uniref:DNA replication complex GINS protein PSF1 n=1 Tax=Rhizophagus irregularis TaxID=588596 RepID=A0A2I1GX06_9GLOM|nr:hypothetical protein RhiirA4_531963 [Rhizophagus irregularis]CAB4433398.1 unnamed protein product [Rhizophagus irregularis]CAB4433453.1 unnamed protein product [Rhizophagus irregularis]